MASTGPSGLTGTYQVTNTLQNSPLQVLIFETSRYEERRKFLTPLSLCFNPAYNVDNLELGTHDIGIVSTGQSIKVCIMDAEKVQNVVRNLYQQHFIDAATFELSCKIKQEIDRCFSYSSKTSGSITVAQKDFIRDFVIDQLDVFLHIDPNDLGDLFFRLTEILKHTNQLSLSPYDPPEKLKKALLEPRFAYQDDDDEEIVFFPTTKELQDPKIHRIPPIISEHLSSREKEQILGSLMVIGRIMVGKADLESTLTKLGPRLSLQQQGEALGEIIEEYLTSSGR